MKKNGFTIIELVVVIAIIAVLATIVTISVMQYINKSKNTAIKQAMANIMTAELSYYSANSGYADICSSSDLSACPFSNFINYINKQGGNANGLAVAGSYCICASLLPAIDTPAGSSYCVSSSGEKVQFIGACALAEGGEPGNGWITCVSHLDCHNVYDEFGRWIGMGCVNPGPNIGLCQ